MPPKHFSVGLLLVLASAFLIRIWGITWGLPSKSLALTTYHPDEAITLYSMERMRERGDLYPDDALWWGSLHYYTTGAVLLGAKALGLVNIGGRSDLKKGLSQADRLYLIGRLLSVIAGLVSVVFIGLLASRLFGPIAGILAAALLAFAPAAIASDHFLKPDSFFLAFGLFGLWLAFKYHQEGTGFKQAFILGFVFGFSASSKYSGFLFWPVAVMASCLLAKEKKFQMAFISLLGLLLGFVLTCPYSVIRPSSFWRYLTGEMTRVTSEDFGSRASLSTGIYELVAYYLPFATSWPIVLAGLIGFVLVIRCLDFKQKIIFLSGSLITFLVISVSHTKNAIYTFPFLPFLILASSYSLAKAFERNRMFGGLLIVFCLSIQMIEGAALARLFSLPNTREKASEWLLKNIRPGAEIGIIRSYYWTVPILRTYESPYKIIKGGDDWSNLDQAVLGWENQPLPNYFVIAEPEYQGFLKASGVWTDQRKVIEEIFSSYKEIAAFSACPNFLGFNLWLRDPPYDFLYIAPAIHILRKL